MPEDWPEPPPEDPGLWQVWAMCFARAKRRVQDNFILRDMHDGPMPLDYNLWVLRNRDRVLLVDTGFSPRAAAARNRPQLFDPIEGLQRIGIDPDTVEDVLITHLHYDHAGNIDRFGKARFHVPDAELDAATGRCICEPDLRMPYDVEDIVALVRRVYTDRVVFHDRDTPLMPGISLHCLPGHSAMVLGVGVKTARGTVLLVSDASHYYANILNMKPFLLTLDTVQTLNSYRRILQLAGSPAYVIPGHDPKTARIYPRHLVNGIELLALHQEPQPLSPEDYARTDDF